MQETLRIRRGTQARFSDIVTDKRAIFSTNRQNAHQWQRDSPTRLRKNCEAGARIRPPILVLPTGRFHLRSVSLEVLAPVLRIGTE
jgi:hypothetical protein